MISVVNLLRSSFNEVWQATTEYFTVYRTSATALPVQFVIFLALYKSFIDQIRLDVTSAAEYARSRRELRWLKSNDVRQIINGVKQLKSQCTLSERAIVDDGPIGRDSLMRFMDKTSSHLTLNYLHCVQEKNTHSRFLLYIRGKFHKVVWQHVWGEVGYLMTTSLQISRRMWQWNNLHKIYTKFTRHVSEELGIPSNSKLNIHCYCLLTRKHFIKCLSSIVKPIISQTCKHDVRITSSVAMNI